MLHSTLVNVYYYGMPQHPRKCGLNITKRLTKAYTSDIIGITKLDYVTIHFLVKSTMISLTDFSWDVAAQKQISSSKVQGLTYLCRVLDFSTFNTKWYDDFSEHFLVIQRARCGDIKPVELYLKTSSKWAPCGSPMATLLTPYYLLVTHNSLSL